MSLLASLPPTLIDAILGQDMSPCAINLWKCGDKLLQHKMATGITQIKLVDHHEPSSSRFPKFILELRSLRELTIDRGSCSMPYYRDLRYHVRGLPPTLKKLKLCVAESIEVLRPPTAPTGRKAASRAISAENNDALHPTWTFAAAFPQLESLELDSLDAPWEEEDFDLLPPSLTSITIPSCDYQVYDKLSSLLSPHFLKLKLTSSSPFPPTFWSRLPPNLTHLHVQPDENVDASLADQLASLLPRSLTKFETNFYQTLNLKDLPSGLEFLNTVWIKPLDPNPYSQIGRFLPNLKTVRVSSTLTPELVRGLPPTVRYMEVSRIPLSVESSHWPASLTKINCRDSDPDFSFSVFPTGLLELTIGKDDFNLAAISNLPRNLRCLAVYAKNIIDSKEVDFPPHLTNLHLVEERASSPERDFPYHNLPSLLTNLCLPVIPASKLKHLPPHLKSLQASDIPVDSDFNPDGEAEIAAMMLNFENGRRDGGLESFDFTQLKRASILALLPRTLDLLKITTKTGKDLANEDWSLIPPRLRSLQFVPSDGIPSSLLQQLPPLRNLRFLRVSLNGAEDQHLECLPRHVKTVHIKFVNSPNLTPMVLCHLRRDVSFEIPHLQECLYRLSSDQRSHCDDEDPTYFLRLLSPDKEIVESYVSK